MGSVAARSKLFHSIVVVGLGTAAGGCGSSAPARPGTDAASDGDGAPASSDDARTGDDAGSLGFADAPDAGPEAPICCSGPVACSADAGDGGGPCCVGDGGGPWRGCCFNFSLSCSATPPVDGGEAGTACGCWPLFV